ncbi:uncharacterized protein BJX67DRAFT_382043 [Aspergillus lucknowensis]|uniref:Uncharacterized protein n=1 Tax=Aspergillus lucknowensis TaxID=176173 RepID=A0ABR4LP51_9EURO
MMRASRPNLRLTTGPAISGSLSLKSPLPRSPRSPRSPLPLSPAPASSMRFSTLQVPQPSYNYVNSCSSKSILKKQASSSKPEKRIQFSTTSPTVHCITPIENRDEYYGSYTKLSKEERRWIVRE